MRPALKAYSTPDPSHWSDPISIGRPTIANVSATASPRQTIADSGIMVWMRQPPAVLERYFQSNLLGYQKLQAISEINPGRRGGVPVLKGTSFTLSQVLAELSDSSGVEEVAQNFELDPAVIRQMLEGLSLVLMRPLNK
jgi:uncharacterized protein (DUF433 family)